MSGARGIEKGAVDRLELLEWVRRRIQELEDELRKLKAIQELLEGGGGAEPGESSEDVKLGRRRIGRLFRGESRVRLVFEDPQYVPEEVEAYLRSVEDDIRASQAAAGDLAPDEMVRLELKRSPDGRVVEIRFEGVHTTIEHLKARAALKYAAETIYLIARARVKGGGEDSENDDEEVG